MKEKRKREIEFLNILKILSPGTLLREGLDNVLKSRTGALIVIGDSEDVLKIIDGGFSINSDYSPSYLYELAKMDGAIIISSDLKKILYANTQLVPDPSIPTLETGTRHKAADRVAKQTDATVISISQRRNIITVYKGNIKYVLRDTSIILSIANQAIQTLEKYKNALDRAARNLSVLEFQDFVTLYDVAVAIQRTEMVLRIVREVERYICELGDEGNLVSMQMNELVNGVETDGIYLIKDYHSSDEDEDHMKTWNDISDMDYDKLLDILEICKMLGYPEDMEVLDEIITPRGYRMLSKIPRLPMSIISNLVKEFLNFQSILKASADELDSVEGIGEVRTRAIIDGLKRLKEQVMMERHI
ncbi:MAG: DNA integrity scanning diadenylate cyclase DisA [Clostridiales bacterium]|nr:DNA integrity scanning diadenylate cyclase DisA [Clostridiales bacterium]HBM80303.1 DNA integrity scanning protein DisA [Clostridiaceae bacterium]